MYRRFKEGDEQAFEELYREYSKEIFNYALKLLGNWDLAEDVLEETFIKLYQSNLNESGKLKSWLYRVATNFSYRTMRRSKYEVPASDAELEHFQRLPQEDASLLGKKIRVLLMKIPVKQRAVIVLKFYQGMKYQDIANILGCPLGTVKTRMHEGLKRLRHFLSEEF